MYLSDWVWEEREKERKRETAKYTSWTIWLRPGSNGIIIGYYLGLGKGMSKEVREQE